ncbi:MAG: UDP-N-acetylglucosamine--N-acetylmuramyl-(pentapeptide) pyrophosphoryl-undecaprenol N-acetylglucosamine transferase [Clostridiales bacterium]|jgi:UDP-N-acetylglucosamine--N-acetylmuramyl-(pentapeptide) pyrophosphoryl-undecaprenol N-acetylglucosamine transferase|nr:UDP-N-acetylglucosamine--N-acetylmuramyl-(pentapeptide) pyrophosphoryl-undecaprenol N-acetylglucosamine transferase [Clostridiales bacterium]
MKKLVLTGGGTAGHVTPNLALVPYLKDEFKIYYIGRPDSIEERLVSARADVTFCPMKSVKLDRGKRLGNILVPFKLLAAKCAAKKLLAKIEPDAIFSKGGYVALPVCLAAGKTPLVIHESDYSMGLANRLSLKKSRFVLTSFPHLAERFPNGVCTGAPLRRELYDGDKSKVEAAHNLRGRKNLLITGGSSGAKAINDAAIAAAPALTRLFDVIHITGKGNASAPPCDRYAQIEFADPIADYYAWADLAVTRGGANALFELAALAVPALVIPLPKGGSRGDQVDNALYFEKLGSVKMLLQENLTPRALIAALENLDRDRPRMTAAAKRIRPLDGTKTVAQIIKDAAGENSE